MQREPSNGRPNATPIRMIAIDLDGTLVHSSGVVTERNRAALRQAREAGIQVVVNTGRRHSYALRAIRALQFPQADAIITSNGAVVRTADGELLWRATLSLPLVHRLLHEMSDFRDALVFTFDLIGPDGADVPGALVLEDLDQLHRSISRWMEVNASSIRRVVPLEDAFTGQNPALPVQAMLCGTMDRMHAAEARLDESFAADVDCYRTEYPGHDLCILDIMPKGKSKGAALLQLAAARGVDAQEILAVGDNWNDEPMLRVAGTAVVLSNAPDDLKERALEQGWHIGPAGDEDGVAEILETTVRSQRAPANA